MTESDFKTGEQETRRKTMDGNTSPNDVDEYPTPTYLRNHEAVLTAYGYWPSFHDAPLLSLEHDLSAAAIDVSVHVWDTNGEIDEHGYFRMTNHHVIALRFTGVDDLILKGFPIPNTLLEITFSPPVDFDRNRRFSVEFINVVGGHCVFFAVDGEVISIAPRAGWPGWPDDD
jgi:hypothetical protein